MKFQYPDKTSGLPGLQFIGAAFRDQFHSSGVRVNFEQGYERNGFTLRRDETGFDVQYAQPSDAYRALGLLLAGGNLPKELVQDRVHESVAVMWDLSRNAVVRVEAWKELFLKFALLGVNEVYLYMEDVYELPGEPFFGYGRGAYTAEELRSIDELGAQLGIEVVPCIQTLGHLEQVLQWPAFSETVDVHGVLLVGEEKTYELIGKMLDQMAACFRSRKIHIGMDEAHGVGTGAYLRRNGFKRPFDILNAHLRKVSAMCAERNLHPLIWSDMYFRIGSKTNDYYDRSSVIPDDVASMVPDDVGLVYWDYEHAETSFYEEWIQRHRSLGKEPVFAGGAASWGRLWAYEPGWRETLDAGMQAARTKGLAAVMLTVWGDDGWECHPDSVIPAIQYFAEWAYAGKPNEGALERQFAAVSLGSALSDYRKTAQLDQIPAIRGAVGSFPNFSKWILWQDPILGFLDAHLTGDLPVHYRELADTLDHPTSDPAIQFSVRLARAVAEKAELHLCCRAAWRSGDMRELKRLRDEVLPACLQAVHSLWSAHSDVWTRWRKPFGWEVLDRRYAGCVARLERLSELLEECLKRPDLKVSEWAFDPLPFRSLEAAYFAYHRAATPSENK